LPEVRMDVLEGGQKVSKPRWASRRFGLTKGQKGKLLPFLVGWRGKSFTPDELTRLDLKVLLGRCCQIQVVHDYSKGENTYANIAQAIPLPKGTVVPQPENPLVWFSWTEGTPIPDTWSKGMQWVKDLLVKSKQFKNRAAFGLAPVPAAGPDVGDDDPFAGPVAGSLDPPPETTGSNPQDTW